jgi:hypothetical protein
MPPCPHGPGHSGGHAQSWPRALDIMPPCPSPDARGGHVPRGGGPSAGRPAPNSLHEEAQQAEAHAAAPGRHRPGRGGRRGRCRRRPVRRRTRRRLLHGPGGAGHRPRVDLHRLHPAVAEGLCHRHLRHQRQDGAVRRHGGDHPGPRVRARRGGLPEVGPRRGRGAADGRRHRRQRRDASRGEAVRCDSRAGRHRGRARGAAAPGHTAVADAAAAGHVRGPPLQGLQGVHQPASARRARPPAAVPSSRPPA